MDLLSLSARFAIDKTDYDRAMDEASKSAQEFGDEFDSVSDSISSNVDTLEGDYKTLADAMGDTTDEADSMDDSLNGVVSTVGDVSGEVSSFTSEVDSAATSMSDAAGEAVTMSDSVGTLSGETSDAGGSMFDFGDIASTVAGIFTGDFSSAISGAIDMVKELATELWDGIKGLAEYGDEVDKQSQKLGISSDAYQEWDAVLQHSGTNIGSLRKSMMQITTAMDEIRAASTKTIDTTEIYKQKKAYESAALSAEAAQKSYAKAVKEHGKNSLEARQAALKLRDAEDSAEDAYTAWQQAMEGTSPALGKTATAIQNLGVAVTDANGNMRSQEDIFKDVIFALQSIEDETTRTTIAQDIFGRSAMELAPLLNTSAEETQGMIDRVHELGGVLSEDTVKASAEFEDALQDMNTAITGLKNMFLSVLLPAATWAITTITNIIVSFRNFLTGIGPAIGSAIQGIGQFFYDIFGGLVSAAASWGKDIIDNFISGIKSMWEKAKGAVSDFAKMIKDFLGFSEPEQGPLSDFHTYAPDMMALFAKGITDNEKLITDAIDDAFNIQPNITQNVSATGTGQEIVVERNTSSGSQSAVMMVDRTVFATLIYTLYNEQSNKVGVQLAGVNV